VLHDSQARYINIHSISFYHYLLWSIHKYILFHMSILLQVTRPYYANSHSFGHNYIYFIWVFYLTRPCHANSHSFSSEHRELVESQGEGTTTVYKRTKGAN